MKRLFIIIVFVCNALVVKSQPAQKYLVFTFNRKYVCNGYKHGTGDHVWIIPFDSCRDGFCEKDMKPLFVDEFQIESLNDSTNFKSGIGEYPIVEYSRRDSIAWLLYKNRRLVQQQINKTSYPKSKDIVRIYCVPIMATCISHEYGYTHVPIVTIDGCPQIWTDFWEGIDNAQKRRIFQHDFSEFDYMVALYP